MGWFLKPKKKSCGPNITLIINPIPKGNTPLMM